jgi:hypothetical protein
VNRTPASGVQINPSVEIMLERPLLWLINMRRRPSDIVSTPARVLPRRQRSPLVAQIFPVSTVQFFRSAENARPRGSPLLWSTLVVLCLV